MSFGRGGWIIMFGCCYGRVLKHRTNGEQLAVYCQPTTSADALLAIIATRSGVIRRRIKAVPGGVVDGCLTEASWGGELPRFRC